MNLIKNILLISLCFCTFVSAVKTKDKLEGTWCAGPDGLMLTFFATDSLHVGSAVDESISGNGVFKHTDSTFSATVQNGDVTMKMEYRYRWKATDTISAQTIFFTVNGDSVQFPTDWMEMTRCSNKK